MTRPCPAPAEAPSVGASAVLAAAAALALALPRGAFAQAGFTAAVSPSPIALVAGGAARTVTVATTVTGSVPGPIAYAFQGLPPGISTGGSRVVGPPYPSTSFPFAAAASVPAGTYTGTLSGSVAGGASVSFPVTVTVAVRPEPPVILGVTPPSLVTGTTGNVLRVAGRNFQPGAVFTSPAAGVVIAEGRILGPGSAEVVVSVRPDATPGPVRLDLANPDGGTARGGARVLIYPTGSLGAPLSVTAATIVTPRPREIVALDRPAYARALLATSGMGTVVGRWLLDGVPFDRFTRVVSGGFPVEVRSAIPIPRSHTGEHRLELAIESPRGLPPRRVPFFQAPDSRSDLRVLAPAAGRPLSPIEPRFRWSLVPGASAYQVELEGLETAAESSPAVERRVTDIEWRPEPAVLERFGDALRFRVRPVYPGGVLGDPTAWRVVPLAPVPPPDGAPEALAVVCAAFRAGAPRAGIPTRAPGSTCRTRRQSAGTDGIFDATLLGSASGVASELDDPPPLTRIQLSTQADVRGPVLEATATGDLSASLDVGEPWDGREESRNWVARIGAAAGALRPTATFGYSPPSFFDRSELLTVATSGAGVEGSLDSPAGRLSYYRSADLGVDDELTAFEPEIEAAAWEASDDAGRVTVRAVAMRALDRPSDDLPSTGEGRALAAIAAADLGPALRVAGEVTTGDYEPGEDGAGEARAGEAFRISAEGSRGTLGYSVALGHTGAGFVNPANRGFTPAGVSDRTRAEIGLRKTLDRVSLDASWRHVRGGIAEASGDPGGSENGANVSLSAPLSSTVRFDFGGHLNAQRGAAVPELGLPRTDRTHRGADLAVTETVGGLSLTQSLTWQELTDAVQPLDDQRVVGLSLSVGGAPLPFLALSGTLSGTRIRAAPEIGTTDQILVSLQPSLSFETLWLDVGPRLSVSRSDNGVQETESSSDQLQFVVRWAPPWAGGLLDLEVASDWRRAWTELDDTAPPFDHEAVLTLTFRWGVDRVWGSAR